LSSFNLFKDSLLNIAHHRLPCVFTEMPQHNTHVANRSDWVLWVNVNMDRAYLKQFEMGGGAKGITVNGKVAYEWERVDKTGLSAVQPGKYKGFHVGHTGTPAVYITILAQLADGRLMVLDDARPIESDRSVIVEKSGSVVFSKYGSIWERA